MAAQRLSAIGLLAISLAMFLQATNAAVSNNQIQTIRKLNSLRLYKDAQFFRYQIPAEITTATFVLNATQSDIQVNSSLVESVWGASQSTIPPSLVPTPTPPPPPKLLNLTILTVYQKKATKFYRSLLSTACKRPLDVTFVLRWGSLPLLTIKNATKPENFIFDDQQEQYRVDLKTDSRLVMLNISNPLPGDWYGIAFIKQIDDKISQKGLERECFYRLESNVSLETSPATFKEATVLTSTQSSPLEQSLMIDRINDNQTSPALYYKFYLTSKEYGAKIVINNCHYRATNNVRHHPIQSAPPSYQMGITPYDQSNQTLSSGNVTCPIKVNFRLLALPSSSKHDYTFDCRSNHSNGGVVEVHHGKCVIDLPTYSPNEWNYIQIEAADATSAVATIFEPRTKILHGSINFTIQLLVGQEAFLYNYFNDQQCQLASGGGMISTTTHNPLLMYPNNYGLHNEPGSVATAVPNNVAPPKLNSLNSVINSGNQINPPRSGADFGLTPPKSPVINSEKPRSTARPAIPHNGNEDSLDYEEENEESNQVVKASKLDKRSPDQGNRERKKNQDRRKEERRLKKLKNKNRKTNAQRSQCQFDPAKILNTLDEDELANMTTYNIVNLNRYQAPENFEFRYSYLNTLNWLNGSNLTVSPFLEVDNDRFSLINFTIIPQFDIGGSLVIDFAISPQTLHNHQNVSAILCLTHNRMPPIISASTFGSRYINSCHGHLVSNTSVANFTTDGSPIQTLAVPYPRPGTWYLSVVIRCYSEDETLEELLMNNDYSCDYNNRTAVLIDIRSSACYNGKCLNGGKCMQYLNGGILYSTCSCRAGWKGFICNDGSEALSEERLLINFLLLTVSNAAFIPAIIVAACRRYFTESAIYLITMFSSALYHACDSAYSQSYCVLSVGLLQFADFYTAVLAFFVTLITLANLSPPCKSFLHLVGAILIALITQNDRTSLWTFAIPAGLAGAFLIICWCTHCCRKSCCYPPTRCWVFSVCPALILTVVGLILYAFFETQDNYAITHSVWHMIVAVALLFAIPSMPSTNPVENEEEDDERVHFMSSSSSSGAGSGKGIQNAKMAHVEWRPPHTSFKFLHDDIDML